MRWLSSGIALVYVGLALLDSLYAFFVGAFACDESCSYPASRWQNDGDAWQWDAIISLAVAGVLTAVTVVGLRFAVRQARPAWAALLVHAAVLVAAAMLIAASGGAGVLFSGTWIVLTIAVGALMLAARSRGSKEKLAPLAKT
jgi:hypothetical protein